MGLRSLVCLNCRFEVRWGHGSLSPENVVFRQVEVFASGRSLFKTSPTNCGVSECDREAWTLKRLWPSRRCCATGGKNL